jgi:class 3 adenylate cyclase/tetratricopeptide (TPR) repeat protein
MVGFTQISERLGEEGTFALLGPIYELMTGAIVDQGGTIKDFFGDGVMALFGVPHALEDAPLRACRAGLAIQEGLAAVASAVEAKYGVRPEIRIGLNSGLAVVTQIRGDSGPATALGDTVNLASRLQALAEPGAIYLTEATHRLVQGLVQTSFAGEFAVKGKAERQKVYRLQAVRLGATRFDAAVGRGLSAYVGRERELDILDVARAQARGQTRVIDIVAESGMGKSRLLYEFQARTDTTQTPVLKGSCTPDGHRTPFLPFIDVVRDAFQVNADEAEAEIARKLEFGLNTLGHATAENHGLLLNLLGLKAPKGALAGLDGMLIGLRTRDLLQSLLKVRSRISPLVLLLEDVHWADSVSKEVLAKLIEGETELALLVLHTRRPEYEPPWRNNPNVTTLPLDPLPEGDITRLIQVRLGAEVLPAGLVGHVTEKAGGNALFAEEILSFLAEKDVLRIKNGIVEFDDAAVLAALPASVQSLLTARVDKLAPNDRALLQAAAVIGRRFSVRLLAAVLEDASDVEMRLGAMQPLDLVYLDDQPDNFTFKHALVRDALYQSLLTGPRARLHSKIAEEIERRSGNRLPEVVESLAHHYAQTDRADKAFAYLAMTGKKSLGVYAIDDAGNHFAAAIALLDKHPDCASDQQIAGLLIGYALCLHLSARFKSLTEIVTRFMPRLDHLGNDPGCVLVHHHYVGALLWLGRYREAEKARLKLSAMAAGLSDAKSKAYALASIIHITTVIAPMPVEVFEAVAREAKTSASHIDDAYLHSFLRYVVGWEEAHRGRINKAREAAEELMAVGSRMNDPRSIGLGMMLQSWIAQLSGDYPAALDFAEKAISAARTPLDRVNATNSRIAALVLLRRPEALPTLRDWLQKCEANDWRYLMTAGEAFYGVALVMKGEIFRGVRWLQQAALRRDEEGYRGGGDQDRGFLMEVYLETISSKEKLPIKVLLRNILTLVAINITAQKRIYTLLEQVRQNPRFDPNGHHIGRCEMILGLLHKAKRKREPAIRHLNEARRIISQFGPSPMLSRIEAALGELS